MEISQKLSTTFLLGRRGNLSKSVACNTKISETGPAISRRVSHNGRSPGVRSIYTILSAGFCLCGASLVNYYCCVAATHGTHSARPFARRRRRRDALYELPPYFEPAKLDNGWHASDCLFSTIPRVGNGASHHTVVNPTIDTPSPYSTCCSR